METKTSILTDTLTLRIPKPLMQQIRTVALAEDRSINNQIVQLLKLALQELEVGK